MKFLKLVNRVRESKNPIRRRFLLGGMIKMEGVNIYTGRRRVLADWFPNLILDQGLDYLGSQTNYLNSCSVGTDNTPPANNDTNLGAQVGTTATQLSSTRSAQNSSPYYGSRVNVYRFAAGDATGNIAEVGIGPSTGTPRDLFSRALILDEEGNPTTISVAADEFLDVSYELRLYPDEDDAQYSIDISGSSYDVTRRAADVDNEVIWGLSNTGVFPVLSQNLGIWGIITYAANGLTFGDLTTDPSSTGGQSSLSGSNKVVHDAYVPGSFERSFTCTWSLLDSNHPGGIGAIRQSMGSGSGGFGAYKYLFDPAIPKTSADILTLSFLISWGRKTL